MTDCSQQRAGYNVITKVVLLADFIDSHQNIEDSQLQRTYIVCCHRIKIKMKELIAAPA